MPIGVLQVRQVRQGLRKACADTVTMRGMPMTSNTFLSSQDVRLRQRRTLAGQQLACMTEMRNGLLLPL